MTPGRPSARWRRAFTLAALGSGIVAGTGLAACEILYPFDRSLPDGGEGESQDSPAGSEGSPSADVGTDSVDASSKVDASDSSIDGIVAPTALTDAAVFGSSLTDDDASLLWLNLIAGFGAIMRTSKADGATTTLVGDAGSNPSGLAVDDAHVYWLSRPVDAGAGGVLLAASIIDGSNVVSVSTNAAWYPTRIAVDATELYVLNNPAGGVQPIVYATPKDGGTPIIIAEAQAQTPQSTNTIALDSANVYWIYASQIFRLPKQCVVDASQCSAQQINAENSSISNAHSFSIDDASVYWTMGGDGTGFLHPCGIWRSSKFTTAPGGDPGVALVYLGCGPATGNAIDGTYAYAFDGDKLWAASLAGNGDSGSAITASQLNPTTPIVADGTAVYWINGGTGMIMRLPR